MRDGSQAPLCERDVVYNHYTSNDIRTQYFLQLLK